ncbi:MAG: N-acetylmuramoyl-L-alanine amidase [Kofleriaceae bacterium]
MGRFRPSGNLIIGGQIFRTDAPIINWREPPYWDATREDCQITETDPYVLTPGNANYCKPEPSEGGGRRSVPYGKLPMGPYTRRYALRPRLAHFKNSPPYEAVKASIKQFVIHHDGCNTADMCFSVLQNERGLSVHFLLDNDGTIYQTIDLGLMAYHASEWNIDSIGIEMCNKGDAIAFPNWYASGKYGPKRRIKDCKINNHTIHAYDYTDEQYDSFSKLCRALQKYLPNLPAEFPQASPGKQQWGTIPKDQSMRFAGYIGHYHLWDQKWDPGPFDFEGFCRKLRGALCYPVFPKGEPKKNEDRPAIPDQADELKDDANELYKANESRADGGFFPVGPWGESRLWHGGVHLAAKEGSGVFAPFPGRLVAARMGKDSAIGSNNFALLRHDMNLGAARVQFYSLYMHLGDELKTDKPVPWAAKSEAFKAAKPGDVVLLDEGIEAGVQIGRVGRAGPAELSKPQLHLAFFSTGELFAGVPGASLWTTIDGTSGGRFCDAKQINDVIDANHDGMLSRAELSQFYSSGNGAQMHYVVPLFVSEWTFDPSWGEQLRLLKDYKKMKPADIDQLVADQITPGLWWDSNVAAHCRLPADGIVYHYHPVAFLAWFNQQLLDAAATTDPNSKVNANDAREVPKGITDDFGDKDGTTMRSSADVAEDPCNKKLSLNDLVQGFDAPECTP